MLFIAPNNTHFNDKKDNQQAKATPSVFHQYSVLNTNTQFVKFQNQPFIEQ